MSADPQPATTAVPRQANPLRTSAFRALRDTCCSSSPIDRRDRALLLIGLASALRRAELAALTVADLDYVEEGVRLYIARSKTDQAAGQIVGVVASTPTCPVAALRTWLEAADITDGAVFRAIKPLSRGVARLHPRGNGVREQRLRTAGA